MKHRVLGKWHIGLAAVAVQILTDFPNHQITFSSSKPLCF